MIKTKRATEQINVDLERDKKFLVDLDQNPVIGYHKKVTGVLTRKPRKRGK